MPPNEPTQESLGEPIELHGASLSASPVENSLGRTNNFRIVFFPEGGFGGDLGRQKRDELGEIWIRFVKECPTLVATAIDAVRVLNEKQVEELVLLPVATLKDLILSGRADEADRLAAEASDRLAPYATAARDAVEVCYDELLRRGASESVLWG